MALLRGARGFMLLVHWFVSFDSLDSMGCIWKEELKG